MNEQLIGYLERITVALERISDFLSQSGNGVISINRNQVESFKKSLNEDSNEKTVDATKDDLDNVNRICIIENYLNERKIKIKMIPQEDEADQYLDKIAVFMGKRYGLIKNFLEQIKSKLSTGDSFRMDLKNHTQEEIASICQLATMLHEIAFLEDYNYMKSPKYVLFARPNRIPIAINFLTGKWLERYIRTQIISLISHINPTINFSYIMNPLVTLPNGDYFEFDFLLEIEGEIFWMEAKTGDYQRYVNKYSKIANILNLDTSHAFMILTDITDAGVEALKSLFNMNVVSIKQFSDEFTKQIQKYTMENIFSKPKEENDE